MKIYKYLGPDILEKSLKEENFCSFKCSYPKDFNDPYELFLTIDFNQEPDLLACYMEAIGEIPQLPTTCFSKSPSVIPMWAHYAHNHRGVVVEIDTDILKSLLPDIMFGNVEYRDEPFDGLLDLLRRLHLIGKPRYFVMLQKGVLSAAYFTKQGCWSYEQEVRVVAQEEDVSVFGDLQLLKLPIECITALIVGHNADKEIKDKISKTADEISTAYYEMKIGKSSAQPYFVDSSGEVHEFNGTEIAEFQYSCGNCGEPAHNESDLCPWCSITDDNIESARFNSPARIFSHFGLSDAFKELYKI